MARLTIADMQARAAVEKPAPSMPVIKVGMSTCGLAAGADAVYATLGREVAARSLEAKVARTGCAGMCSMEPLVEVKLPDQPAVMYGEVTPEFAARIVAACADGKPLPTEFREIGRASCRERV